MSKPLKAHEIDERFDNGENVDEFFDMEHPVVETPVARDCTPHPVNTTLPAWLVKALDEEAQRRCVSRKAVINTWLVDRADAERRSATA